MTQEIHPYLTTPINQLVESWCREFDQENKMATVAQVVESTFSAGLSYGAWRAFSSKTLSLRVKVLTITLCTITIFVLGLFIIAGFALKNAHTSFTAYLRKLGNEAKKKQDSGATTIESYRHAFQEMKKADYDRMTTRALEVFRRLEVDLRTAELPGQEKILFYTPYKRYYQKNITKHAGKNLCVKAGEVHVRVHNKKNNWQISYSK